jgi:hypothetical protein
VSDFVWWGGSCAIRVAAAASLIEHSDVIEPAPAWLQAETDGSVMREELSLMVQRRSLFGAVVGILFVVLVLAGCARPRIEGEVVDNFGQPVEGARITITGERYSAKTNGEGHYSIRFKPGRLTVLATKEGCIPDSLTATLEARRPFQARTLELFRRPPGPGLFLLGAEGYVALPRGDVLDQVWERDEGWSADHLFRADGEAAAVSPGHRRFVDSSGLEKVVLIATDEDGRIGEMTTGFMGAVESSDFHIIEHDEIILESRMILREVDLEPGYYAFVEWQEMLFAPERPGSLCYWFRVE